MSQYLETLDQREALGKHWLFSLGVHAAVLGMLAFTGLRASGPNWGSLTPGGGSMGVNVVKSIPLPARPGLENPLASDTHTTVPLPPPAPAKPEPKAKEPPPDDVPIGGKKTPPKKKQELASSKTKYRAPGREELNQIFSDTGPALKSPLIGQTGTGGSASAKGRRSVRASAGISISCGLR